MGPRSVGGFGLENAAAVPVSGSGPVLLESGSNAGCPLGGYGFDIGDTTA